MRKARECAEEQYDYRDGIFIETTLNCNSRCIFCAHHEKVMTGTMTMELYRKIIDNCSSYGIKQVTLSVYGELMLDKYLFDRVRYLRKYPAINYGFFTNASLFDKEKVDQLLDMGGLKFVAFSVNGYSKDVYEKTMVGLKRDVAYRNILYFLEEKQRRRLHDLTVTIATVLTKINEGDFKQFFDFWSKQKGVDTILPTELIDRMGREYRGEIGPLGPMQRKDNWLSPCRMVWCMLMIYFDGRVAPCCDDNDDRQLIVGDVSKQSLEEIIAGKSLKRLRELHLNNMRATHPICGKCYHNSVWFGLLH
jgi:MoaA/NifB/PqqE/SkfB family radical SAM enzyme